MRLTRTSAAVFAAMLCTGAATTANAAVVGLGPVFDLTSADYTFSIGEAASYTFSNSGAFGPFGNLLPAIQTGGTATVISNGLPFFDPPRPATYFTDPGRTPVFDATTLGSYVAYATAAVVDATTDSFIGLKFTLADGDHFGFARLAGLTLFDIAYETDPFTAVAAGPGPYAPIAVAPIPLPAALPLLGLGLGALVLTARRRNAA